MRFVAPKGNKFALGNRGGARKSAYVEKSNAEKVRSIFAGQYIGVGLDGKERRLTLDDIREKIRAGKNDGWDIVCFKIWTGNDRILSEMLRKMVPDLVDVTSLGQSVALPPDEMARLAGLFGRRDDA